MHDPLAERAEFIARLELDGEELVRMHLAAGNIYGTHHRGIVEEWLRSKVASRSEASSSQHLAIARSAKNAAWAAAIAAAIAAMLAIVTVVINPPWVSSESPPASASQL